jgi:hypothetical protein
MVMRQEHVIEPRGLTRTEAAFYVGIPPSLFDQLVKEGRCHGTTPRLRLRPMVPVNDSIINNPGQFLATAA